MGHTKGTWQKFSKEIEVVAKTYFICLKCKLNRPNKIKKSRFTIFKMLPSLNCTLIYKNEKCIKHGFTGPKCFFMKLSQLYHSKIELTVFVC